MDFPKISLWLVTAILSVCFYSESSATGCSSCIYNPYNYERDQQQRECFCFNTPNNYTKVPEVINPGRLYSERLVVYLYKDVYNDQIKVYIPNREKQYLIPDLSFELGDVIIDNPYDISHTYNDYKVVIDTRDNKHIPNEISVTTDAATTETTVTEREPSVTTAAPTIIDEIVVTNEIPTVLTEKPSVTTKQPAIPTEVPITTTEVPISTTEVTTTTTTKEQTVTTEEPSTIIEQPVTSEKPTVITEKPTTVSTVITEEPTTTHTPEIIIITEETTVSTKVPITTEPPQTNITPEETTIITKEPSTINSFVTTKTIEESTTTNSPDRTLTTADSTTSEAHSIVTISPPPIDTNSGKVFSLQDLYKIIQIIQTKDKKEPTVDLWEQILRELKLDKSQVNTNIETDQSGSLEYETVDDLDVGHNSNTFDVWFEHQLDGFAENDNFISLVEIKEYVRKILLENGMIVTIEGLLTDLHGNVLDLSDLKLRPLLIGKPFSIEKIFEQKEYQSDFLIPSDSPYMQAIVVTLSNPSRILGIIPLGKTTIKKTVLKHVTVQPPWEDKVKDWVQNGKNNVRKQNWWFNIKGHPNHKKIIKHQYIAKPTNEKTVITIKSPTKKYIYKSSRLLGNLTQNDLRELWENQLLKDPKELATQNDLHTPVDLEPWENQLKDATSSEKSLNTLWENNYKVERDGNVNLNDPIEQLIIDSKWNPANGLPTGWEHLGHLQAGSVLEPNELDALNNKLVNGPNGEKVDIGNGHVISFKTDDPSELEALKNQLLKNPNLLGKAGIKLLAALNEIEITKTVTDKAIIYNVDDLEDIDNLRNYLLKDPIPKKLLNNKQLKGIEQEENGDDLHLSPSELDELRNQLLKHPKILARATKGLLPLMEHNGIVLSDITPDSNEIGTTSPRDLPSTEKSLSAESAEHVDGNYDLPENYLSLGVRQWPNENTAYPPYSPKDDTSLEKGYWPDEHKIIGYPPYNPNDHISPEKGYWPDEHKIIGYPPYNPNDHISPEKGYWPDEDTVGYPPYLPEHDITGRIIGGSAATGSGAPLSMKGRMKDN